MPPTQYIISGKVAPPPNSRDALFSLLQGADPLDPKAPQGPHPHPATPGTPGHPKDLGGPGAPPPGCGRAPGRSRHRRGPGRAARAGRAGAGRQGALAPRVQPARLHMQLARAARLDDLSQSDGLEHLVLGPPHPDTPGLGWVGPGSGADAPSLQ